MAHSEDGSAVDNLREAADNVIEQKGQEDGGKEDLPELKVELDPSKVDHGMEPQKKGLAGFKENRQKKKIHKELKKDAKKNSFIQHKILPTSAEAKAKDNPLINQTLDRFKQQKFNRVNKYQESKSIHNLEGLQQKREEMNKIKQEETKTANSLKRQMFEEDFKNLLAGPAGWLKGCKGCFMGAACIVLVMCGSIALSILAGMGVI